MAIDLYKNRCAVYEGAEPYIFVSYSHKDSNRIVNLIRRLQSEGFRVWYDSGVPAGTEWPEEIATHLKNSHCILSLLSPDAAVSRHFKEEFNYAYYLNKRILVAYLEDCELTPGIEMRVVSQQSIKCEHCNGDEDLFDEIVRAKILGDCQERIAEIAATPPDPTPELTLKSETKVTKTKIEKLREKAENGDAKAQFSLGWAYDQGDGVPQSDVEASKWYRKAADQGHQNAQFNLGNNYFDGRGVQQNFEEGINLYRKSADQGYASAQFNLALQYMNGKGIEKNPQEAVRLYQLAADQNHKGALNNLAHAYENGNGVKKDMAKALELYRKAADLGNALSAQNLGKCYEFSIGVSHDWEQAVYWYRKSAEKGQPYSQQKLAQCYRDGLGVPMDKEKAQYWQKLYDENPNK